MWLVNILTVVVGASASTWHLCEELPGTNPAYNYTGRLDQQAVLSCSSNLALNISSAFYGRKTCEANLCYSTAFNDGNCRSSSGCSANTCTCEVDVTSMVQGQCHGNNQCLLVAANKYLSEPCNGENKYLEVTYTCVTNATVMATAQQASCTSSQWNHMKTTSGCPRSCMAVTDEMPEYKTCRNYCASQQVTNGGGLDCVGAWDDMENQCTDQGGEEQVRAPAGGTTCDFDFGPLGTSDAVCECGVPSAGSALIVPNITQMNEAVPCGDLITLPTGMACPTADNDAQLSQIGTQNGLWTQNTCADWVSAGLPGLPPDPKKGEGCSYCVGGGVVGCILCPNSCSSGTSSISQGASSEAAGTMAPTEAPTEAPTVAAVVRVQYTIMNLDYAKVNNNATLKSEIVSAVKEGTLASLPDTYTVDDLEVALTSGSVKADVTIMPKGDDTPASITTTVSGAKAAMDTAVNTKVVEVRGVDQAVADGMTLSDVSTTSMMTSPTPAPPSSAAGAAPILSHWKASAIFAAAAGATLLSL